MRILVRCDGGPGLGVGHVVRSLALAEEAMARGHSVDVLGVLEGDFLRDLASALDGRLRHLGPGPTSTTELAAIAGDYDVVHVDHYEVGRDLLARIQSASGATAPAVMSNVADGAFGSRDADLLLDPTVDAQWSAAPATARWHLRGSRYVPLRAEVRRLAGSADPSWPSAGSVADPLRVVVVMGGTDPHACAPPVVDALAATGIPLDVTVVATTSTQAALDQRATAWAGGRLTVTHARPDLLASMAAADLVVSAAGTSVWELCAMRRPMAVVAVVDNQVPGYDSLVRAGAAAGLGRPEDLRDTAAATAVLEPLLTDSHRRTRLAQAAGAVVDGLGAWRVVRSWEEVVGGATNSGRGDLEVRPATTHDAELLLAWRNDPLTREHSRSREPVPMEAHLAWLHATLEGTDRHLLVGERENVPVGTVRWDLERAGEWEVSITLAPQARGRGLAAPLLAAAEDWLAAAAPTWGAESRDTGPVAYLAVVHADNAASRRLFLRSGYLPDLPADEAGFERFAKWAGRP